MTVGALIKTLSVYKKTNQVRINGEDINKIEIICDGYIRIITPNNKIKA